MEMSTEMLKGTIVPVVLKLLNEREMYGYEIIKVVNERTNNLFAWKEGTLYPWLHRLEGEGLITSHWVQPESGRKRKYYGITGKGVMELESKIEEWQCFSKAVNCLLLSPGMA